MKKHRKQKLYGIVAVIIGMGLAVSLMIYALGQNVNLYYTPSQLVQAHPPGSFRIGGMVQKGSLQRQPGSLAVTFKITDFKNTLPVHYVGILPALFREGQGIVVQGQLNGAGEIRASQVLAKHDEKYMPPKLNESPS
ncbi:MAG: cytochrome c maturation protein CcmE [Gammaproteobacteria bacterium]